MEKEVKSRRVGFGGTIPDHKHIPIEDAKARWQRGHDQRELKAYLKGKPRFSHGRVPAVPVGFRPIQFMVRELREPIERIQ